MRLNEKECKNVKAGSISGNLISALTKVMDSILDVGRACGSALRGLTSNKSCVLR